MRDRIDRLRKNPRPVFMSNTGPIAKDGVIITGTPGIGRCALLYYIHLTASVGKSTFLDYILAREAALQKRVIYWCLQSLYFFDGPNIYFIQTAQPVQFGPQHTDALCLVDTLEGHPPPLTLVLDQGLFVIQAASPNLSHKAWKKKRFSVREFVLNPPEEAEMIDVSGLFSLFSTDTDWS
jgi:hypothetical protein